MYNDSRKIYLIEEVLKVKSEATLTELEGVLKKSKKTIQEKLSIYDFLGVMNKKETTKMRKAIEETCETINEDDWK
ncbi:MAG TPA: hypothetical protein VN958_09535 [Chitinophagaceae bacterium]|nr:hypothetical protein [Chitinophagaceae bacterium]